LPGQDHTMAPADVAMASACAFLDQAIDIRQQHEGWEEAMTAAALVCDLEASSGISNTGGADVDRWRRFLEPLTDSHVADILEGDLASWRAAQGIYWAAVAAEEEALAGLLQARLGEVPSAMGRLQLLAQCSSFTALPRVSARLQHDLQQMLHEVAAGERGV
ncbi:unnamed protein product, partial [Closterium sp. NIES-54]